MPNNVTNKLTVLMADPKYFALRAKGRDPISGDREKHSGNTPIELKEDQHLSFHELVPLPGEFKIGPYGDMTGTTGYDMEIAAWGLKWGAYSEKEPVFAKGSVTYEFENAWSHPHVWLQKASKLFPDALFLLSYGGDGPTRGRIRVRDGMLEDVAGEDDGPDYPEGDGGDSMTSEEEDAEYDLYLEAQYYFLSGHDLWVSENSVKS